jgi:hypothetical protein
MVMFHSYVSLPEGKTYKKMWKTGWFPQENMEHRLLKWLIFHMLVDPIGQYVLMAGFKHHDVNIFAI